MQHSSGTQLHKGKRQNDELGWRKEEDRVSSWRLSGSFLPGSLAGLAHCALGNPDSLLNAATLSSLPIMSHVFFSPSEAANQLHISMQTSFDRLYSFT